VRVQSTVLALVLHTRDGLGKGGKIAVTARNVLLGEAEAQAMGRLPGAYLRIVVVGDHAAPPEGAAGPAADSQNPSAHPEEDPRLRAVRAFTRRSGGYLTTGLVQPGTVELLLPALPPGSVAAPEAPHGAD
jgi:hypothetical protein